MLPQASRTRPRLITALISLLLVLGGLTLVSSPAQALAAPTKLRAVHMSTQSVGLRWTVTGEDAYRLRFSEKSNMSNPKTWDVIGNYFEWTHFDPHPTRASHRLEAGKTYYVQIKAVKRAPVAKDRSNLTKYSGKLKVTLPTKGQSELKPMYMKATPAGADSMHVSWTPRGGELPYIVRYSTNKSQSVLKWKKVSLDTPGTTIEGLKPNTTYYFRSRVVDAKGKAVSNYSSVFSGKTESKTTSPAIDVMSYNVLKASTANWAKRRGPLAETIKSISPDVLALQEATPQTVPAASGGTIKQYDDVVDLAGKNYELVTRKGSSGTKLAYNKSTVTPVSFNVAPLTTLGDAERFAVWAIFQEKASKKRFFVINTHLEPGASSSSAHDAARVIQANEILGLISKHSDGLPVVITGDMNSSRAFANGQYGEFTRAGFVDPLDNGTGAWDTGLNAKAEHIIHAEYNSFNNLERAARRTAWPLGTNIDYIYTSPSVRVAKWRTVVNLNDSREFVGTIPSDHNALNVTIHLP